MERQAEDANREITYMLTSSSPFCVSLLTREPVTVSHVSA